MTDDEVPAFLDRVEHPVRRRDAYHYRYATGHEGDAPAAGFSPRKAATTIYLADGVDAHPDLLDRLGPHTTGVGCVYVKDLAQVDLAVLEALVAASYTAVSPGSAG